MDAPTSPSRWGRLVLKHRSARLLARPAPDGPPPPGGWAPFGCSWLCLPVCLSGADPAALTSSPARPAEDCPLAQFSCFVAVRSIRSGPPSAGWPPPPPSAGWPRVRLCPSGPEDMDATPSPARLGAFSSRFLPCPLLTTQVELGPDLGCALLSALALPPVPRLW